MPSYGFFEDDSIFEQASIIKNTRCGVCGLYRGCMSPKMKATGKGKVPILWIAEAPEKSEDRRQLVGKAGKRLRRRIKSEMGIDLNDCRKINAINCRPPKNKTPTPKQIECCRPMVMKEIKKFKPKLIILLGDSALKSVVGTTWKKDFGKFERWQGRVIPDQKFKKWICITYSPSFVLIRDNDSPIDLFFRRDLRKFKNYLNKKVPIYKNYQNKFVKVIRDEDTAIKWLRRVNKIKPALLAFDYETTGLKPHAKGHRIISTSICWNKNFAISFMIKNRVIRYLIKILRNKRIGKIAANMKYEQAWSKRRLDISINNWIWDTMLASHILDNRTGITGLKFQVYIEYGIPDYDSKVEPFIGSKKKSTNSFNRLNEIDNEDILLYGGLDSFFEFQFALKQMLQMGIIDQKNFSKTGKFKICDTEKIFNSLNTE